MIVEMTLSMLLAVDLIKAGEGFSATPYICPAGKKTIGYGRNLGAFPLTENEKRNIKINLQGEMSVDSNTAEEWLKEQVKEIYSKLKGRPCFTGIGDERQAVLIDLYYNLGAGGFNQFTKFQKAMENKDYDTASQELMTSSDGKTPSQYAQQVKGRAKRNAEIILTGKISKNI